jgi:hypothetical protein
MFDAAREPGAHRAVNLLYCVLGKRKSRTFELCSLYPLKERKYQKWIIY